MRLVVGTGAIEDAICYHTSRKMRRVEEGSTGKESRIKSQGRERGGVVLFPIEAALKSLCPLNCSTNT